MSGFYFPSITTIAIIVVALYCEFFLSMLVAAFLRGITVYYFLRVLGNGSNRLGLNEHFWLSIGIAVLTSFLGSVARSGFRSVIIARQDAEDAKFKAENLSALMEKMLVLVTHDIRNPLTSITMGCEIIERATAEQNPHRVILTKMLNGLKRIQTAPF